MTVLERVLAEMDRLPPMPGVALKLVQVLNRPDSRVEEIVECIQYDPGITADVLRMCNSAHFGLVRTVTSLHEAACHLGTMSILQIVLARHAGPLLARENRGYGLPPGLLWRHSVAVAIGATGFAQFIESCHRGPAFTAGLLHDIGKIALNQHVGSAMEDILAVVRERNLSFVEAERQVLGCSHDEIGARLAEKWGLPEAIIRCIRYHHAPAQVSPPDPLVDVIYLANAVCLMLGIGVGADELLSRTDPKVLERRGLSEENCEQVGIQMLTDLKRVEELFSSAGAVSPAKPARLVGAGKHGS
jgi:putative nucleotidyltransferase with HDIG domain